MQENKLPLNKHEFAEFVERCVSFGVFIYDDQEFHQQEGLAMGLPLSAVMGSLFVDKLEAEHDTQIVGPKATWYRYVDDVLVVLTQQTDINHSLQHLNNIHPKI